MNQIKNYWQWKTLNLIIMNCMIFLLFIFHVILLLFLFLFFELFYFIFCYYLFSFFVGVEAYSLFHFKAYISPHLVKTT